MMFFYIVLHHTIYSFILFYTILYLGRPQRPASSARRPPGPEMQGGLQGCPRGSAPQVGYKLYRQPYLTMKAVPKSNKSNNSNYIKYASNNSIIEIQQITNTNKQQLQT